MAGTEARVNHDLLLSITTAEWKEKGCKRGVIHEVVFDEIIIKIEVARFDF